MGACRTFRKRKDALTVPVGGINFPIYKNVNFSWSIPVPRNRTYFF